MSQIISVIDVPPNKSDNFLRMSLHQVIVWISLAYYVSSFVQLPLTLYGTQNKKEYAYNQSYARRTVVLPDMGQKEKEREENHMSGA